MISTESARDRLQHTFDASKSHSQILKSAPSQNQQRQRTYDCNIKNGGQVNIMASLACEPSEMTIEIAPRQNLESTSIEVGGFRQRYSTNDGVQPAS